MVYSADLETPAIRLSKMDSYRPPLFVIGNPRSGTSLLRLLLTSHPDLLIPPECGFIIWLRSDYGNWRYSDCAGLQKISRFIAQLFRTEKFETWGLYREVVRGEIERPQPRNYQELCAAVYSSYGISVGKKFKIWGDKNNFYIRNLDEIFSLFKIAFYLHILRDGRDVACSYRQVMAESSKSPYAPELKTEIAEIALDWTSNVLAIDSFMNSIPLAQSMTIKYEDLVFSPSRTTKWLCKWIGLPFDLKMLSCYKINADKKI